MFYTAEKRKAKLDEIRNNPREEVKNKSLPFEYNGNPRYEAKVYKIPLEYLIFNQFNARIADELKTYQAIGVGDDREYNEALEQKIKDILWEQGGKNQITLTDLKKRGQNVPGVVTADGVIVSGNRRAMLLSRLKEEGESNTYFIAAILDEAYDGNKKMIVRLEARLQHTEIGTQDYGATAKQFSVFNMRKNLNLDWKEIASDMAESENKVKQYYEEMITMLDYLAVIGTPNVYTNLRIRGTKGTKEEAFRQTNSNYKNMIGANAKLKLDWPYDDNTADQYKEVMYDYIRAYNLSDTSNFRKIGPGSAKDKKGFLANEKIWNEFYESHIKITHPATTKLKDFDEYASMPECKGLDPKQIAEKRESEWEKQTSNALKNNFEKFEERINSINRENEPGERIRLALSHLKLINHEEIKLLNEIPNNSTILDQLNEIEKKIKEIHKEIEQN